MPSNIQLLMEFCDRNYEMFQVFIEEEYDIEPTEAELILKEVAEKESTKK